MCERERSAERACCLLVLNLVASTPPYPPAGAACRVLGVCGRVYVCTQAFIGFLAFELLVNNASSATLAPQGVWQRFFAIQYRELHQRLGYSKHIV